MLNYDPIENTEKYKEAMKIIQPELNKLPNWVSNEAIENRKKELLQEKGITWKSVRDLNEIIV